ncbi:MAG TPA: archease [Acidimicrobiales bacterium]
MTAATTGHPPSRGHELRPHTADVVIEAWGPDAAACYEEAAEAFVSIFVDVGSAAPNESVPFDVGPGCPEELLVLLLEEILMVVETNDAVPASVQVDRADDRVTGRFGLVPPEQADRTGPVPKGVSYSDLEFVTSDGRCRCRATIDV